MKKKCLISGARGLIGSHLLCKMTDAFEIYAMVRKDQNFENASLNKDLHLIELDLNDSSFSEQLPKKMDLIIHLAQSPYYRDFPEKALDVFSVNSMAALRLLDYATKAEVKKFILASSGVVYGEGQRTFTEDEDIIIPNKNLGFYHTSKLCAELLAENYTKQMTVTILRFFFVYGPGQKKSMLLPRLVDAVSQGKPIFLQGQNGIRINPVHVSDATDAILKAIQLDVSHKINVAGTEILTLREIGKIIGKTLGKTPVFESDTRSPPNDVIGNIEKMKQLLISPTISFQSGIENYINTSFPNLCLKTL